MPDVALNAPNVALTPGHVPYVAKPGRFKTSKQLTWFCVVALVLMSSAVIAFPSGPAAQVVTVIGPIIGAMAMAYSGITNWAEVRRP